MTYDALARTCQVRLCRLQLEKLATNDVNDGMVLQRRQRQVREVALLEPRQLTVAEVLAYNDIRKSY